MEVTTQHLLSAVISASEQLAEGGVRLERDDGLRAVRDVTVSRCLRDLAAHAPRPGEESRSPTRRQRRVNRRNPWWTVSAAAAADSVAASGSSGGAVLGRLAGALLDETAGDRDARAMLERLRGRTSTTQ
ncbi:hypothetical protein Rhe02_08370 [Rhizocola hellebori]|uniref:Uncharacterized protein n=1 Tax=Rhizocola hellebori TaxID=1392758 RepID=A0A8J3VDJ2_9ACTN|nr:hypothetical protein [Rhizocola hellebori]GIH02770.1 hypothetical protein Rhe02_08370 [Rhizocola hellebori]